MSASNNPRGLPLMEQLLFESLSGVLLILAKCVSITDCIDSRIAAVP